MGDYITTFAPLVDIMWGGTVNIGPKIKHAASLEAAMDFIQTITNAELKARWESAFDYAGRNAGEMGCSEQFGVTIVEFTDGSVQAISSKNYFELLRRSDPEAFRDINQRIADEEAAAAAAQDGAAP